MPGNFSAVAAFIGVVERFRRSPSLVRSKNRMVDANGGGRKSLQLSPLFFHSGWLLCVPIGILEFRFILCHFLKAAPNTKWKH